MESFLRGALKVLAPPLSRGGGRLTSEEEMSKIKNKPKTA
jgi:hypothetical protein